MSPPRIGVLALQGDVPEHLRVVQVLARVGSGPAAGRIVAVRQGLLMATAFHPETCSDLRVHRTCTAMVATPAS